MTAFLVIGVSEQNGAEDAQTSLVGVGSNLEKAEDIVSADYITLLNRTGRNALNTPARKDNTGPGPTYSIDGYTWHLVPMDLDQVVNFTL